jgi:murein DD-endopeptidase MepM/ murein hydrolase activator NlpD
MMIGHAPGAVSASVDGIVSQVSADGLFVIGFPTEAPDRAILEVQFADGRTETRVLEIAQRTYAVERIDGLPAAQVTPPQEVLDRIVRENAAIGAVRALDTPVPWFAGGFQWPATGRISGVYGSRRILNGQPRQPHYGLDVAAPTGTPVVAPAPGIIAMAEADLYYTGGTVMIDHGFGVTSVLSHLSAVLVTIRDHVSPGDVVGLVGATGRATGAHLDWRVNWFTVRLDPALLVPPMP